jgi:hypothetical protein
MAAPLPPCKASSWLGLTLESRKRRSVDYSGATAPDLHRLPDHDAAEPTARRLAMSNDERRLAHQPGIRDS